MSIYRRLVSSLREDRQPFRIAVSDSELADLQYRLRHTRWSAHVEGAGWRYGTDPAYLRELVDYWAKGFDWRSEERRLNTFPQFRSVIDGLRVHYVHQMARDGGGLPVLVLHGWPGSFVQMLDLLPLLAAPAEHEAAPADAFDVVVGSLPGFGFSEAPPEPGMTETRMAQVFHKLMTEVLGYERYAVRGSDFGGSVAETLARLYPWAVLGIHLSGTTPRADDPPADPSPAIRRYIDDVERWRAAEVGYGAIQATKPQTLAAALNNSPVGLAAWIVEKFRRWSDCDGDVERRFTKDQLLTNISIYWFTQTIGSSIRLYGESDYRQDAEWDVPTAHLMSSKDMFPTPREWVERFSRVDRWTSVERGGHFMEWEEPGLVAEDMRAFFRGLR
ncbi:Pimeloyl-ACP methyl ester carboxylesterase [Amycolatopsis pretoriensis]|uniref:Pimeloyl-ACP methyl ester carboxylesterase n=1 Tax=Amycolatopsis pretoriensis TaxID=218821 RepID=A0A1H5RKN0_9PSEU|nr:epoxide hydrolase family protein [Amycolatopsis pretoriensis]SEF38067.1 Pimeloyl-ACP methyl ester carboxylesterase [Amycolatopsis pretoriensis]